MTRADRTAAQWSPFELLCWSFWDIVGEQIWNIYLVNIHCFLTQECHHKKHMCRRAGPLQGELKICFILLPQYWLYGHSNYQAWKCKFLPSNTYSENPLFKLDSKNNCRLCDNVDCWGRQERWWVWPEVWSQLCRQLCLCSAIIAASCLLTVTSLWFFCQQ